MKRRGPREAAAGVGRVTAARRPRHAQGGAVASLAARSPRRRGASWEAPGGVGPEPGSDAGGGRAGADPARYELSHKSLSPGRPGSPRVPGARTTRSRGPCPGPGDRRRPCPTHAAAQLRSGSSSSGDEGAALQLLRARRASRGGGGRGAQAQAADATGPSGAAASSAVELVGVQYVQHREGGGGAAAGRAGRPSPSRRREHHSLAASGGAPARGRQASPRARPWRPGRRRARAVRA